MLVEDMRLVKKIPSVEVDIDTLKAVLTRYGRPELKVQSWVNKGILVRIKRGWYVLGKDFRSRAYSKEYLANVIYSPSYISLDYALSFYGLIPERVETITSVTTCNSKNFDTPVGRFSYRHISKKAFRAFMDLYNSEIGKSPSFLIASPEKALADKVYCDFRGVNCTDDRLREYLFDDLRIEPEDFIKLKNSAMTEIAKAYGSRKITAVSNLLIKERGATDEYGN